MVPPRPTVFPKIPDVKILDQRTRNERNWLSRRHRGFARRSRNSLTFMPVSNLKIPFTCENGNPSACRNQKLNSLSSRLGEELSLDENLIRERLTRWSHLVVQYPLDGRTRSSFLCTCLSLGLVEHQRFYPGVNPYDRGRTGKQTIPARQRNNIFTFLVWVLGGVWIQVEKAGGGIISGRSHKVVHRPQL